MTVRSAVMSGPIDTSPRLPRLLLTLGAFCEQTLPVRSTLSCQVHGGPDEPTPRQKHHVSEKCNL